MEIPRSFSVTLDVITPEGDVVQSDRGITPISGNVGVPREGGHMLPFVPMEVSTRHPEVSPTPVTKEDGFMAKGLTQPSVILSISLEASDRNCSCSLAQME